MLSVDGSAAQVKSEAGRGFRVAKMTSVENKEAQQENNKSEQHNKHSEEQNENGELVKLSEESLMRQPEEVFDIICKLGEGSYGSVYKALHKESGQVLAIKQVPIDTDLQEIIKEISIMQQCDSHHVVKYYGSYFKDSDLWIVMEYCGAGSVSDIMRLRKKTLTEEEIATVVHDTLRGLEYLHLRRKIHRDIKAGNILLNTLGHAKLADFGVAGQLSDTMAKRNTVIGTPFWMAPEVIQEIGYDCVADIWSLGITALEMAEGKPPYGDIHPMRAIFMIPTKPPPSFREPDQWQPEFIDFVSRCLVKNPEERATATELLQHPFIRAAQPSSILRTMLEEAMEIRESQNSNRQNQIKTITESFSQQQSPQLQLPTSNNAQAEQDNKNNQHNQMHHHSTHHHHHHQHHNLANAEDDDDVDSSTMVRYSREDTGTLKPLGDNGTLRAPIASSDTLKPSGTLRESQGIHGTNNTGTLSMDLGTMVINSDNEEEEEDDEDSTMKRHDTAPGERVDRPLFLDYFDKKEQEKRARSKGVKESTEPVTSLSQPYVGTGRPIVSQQHPASQSTQMTLDEKQILQQQQQLQQAQSNIQQQLHLQQQLQQQNKQKQPQTQEQQQQQHQQQPHQQQQTGTLVTSDSTMIYSPTSLVQLQPKPLSAEERRKFEHSEVEEKNNDLHRQLIQMNNPANHHPHLAHHHPPASRGVAAENQPKFQRSFIDGDFEFLKHLTYEELHQRMATLDQEMEREIDELRQRYQAKRQPILDAMDQKRKRQQNF
ncbi:hypothetical protein Pmani_011378 [Petrolisthes manimaculis]|uniref:non-specific serine/threonine protein kinase n=1 Tax=Petrolisthes manimaculis TaxID=1843537 RepID=A0AAE1Q314_9EUCA|nr:hypothetical protein Pmani_011378 [Petrolisthes manimaculis]